MSRILSVTKVAYEESKSIKHIAVPSRRSQEVHKSRKERNGTELNTFRDFNSETKDTP